MSTVKASVYVPPVTEKEYDVNIDLTNTDMIEKIIYVTMFLTVILFIRKLVLAVFPNFYRCFEVKRE